MAAVSQAARDPGTPTHIDAQRRRESARGKHPRPVKPSATATGAYSHRFMAWFATGLIDTELPQ